MSKESSAMVASSVTKTEDPNGDGTATSSNMKLLDPASSEQGLWQQAWKEIHQEHAKELPPEFQSVDTLDTMGQVKEVQDLARQRAEDSQNQQRKIPFTNKTYRQVYGKVANYAHKFEIVGDLAAQGEPVYAALPWALIKFGIQCAVGEDEAYHTMLSSAELISDLASQYPALEQLYAKIDSVPSKKLRKSFLNFYKTILTFQIYAINYFDPRSKARRLAIGLNPVTADGITHQRKEINDLKHQVDEDAAIVSYEVAKNGIDALTASQQSQDQQLEAIKDGIRALAGKSGQAFKQLSQEQEQRNKVLVAMWKEPLEGLMAEIENREIERAIANLQNVRQWLSAARPRVDLEAAQTKRPMLTLGGWLLEHPNFQQWQSLHESSIMWLYGFAGTGKTGLACRVIHELESISRNGRMAYFFCSNDKSNTGKEIVSRSDPEEALRSIVSQVATLHEDSYVAPTLQSIYNSFGPNSDQPKDLTALDCIELLIAISEDVSITIVFDAFDELDQTKSPRLVQQLQEIIRRSANNVKIFITTRPFQAIEDYLTVDHSIEILAANNGADVREFIRFTLEERIREKDLLNGEIEDDLRQEIESTLTTRAGNMFLYASLLLQQICDKNHNDDPASIRKKLQTLPRDLTDVYNRTIIEVHDNKSNSDWSCQIAQNTIKWLLCAQEPLSNDAFLEAVSPPERKAKHQEVERACRTLVVKGRNTYEFAHYSVREHVAQMEEYSPSKCHLVATKSCLSVLDTSFGIENQRQASSEPQKVFEQYALFYWPVHYERINQNDIRDQRASINTMLRSLLLQGRSQRNKYQAWFEEVRKKERQLRENEYLASKLGSLQASPLNPLFAACVFGLEDLIAKFGRELDGLNKSNDHGQSALCLAIENGKLDVVKALLSRRFPADLNLLNARAVQQWLDWDEKSPGNTSGVILYASAAQCAAATGQLDILKHLIQQGAHIDLVAGYYGSPLQAAALNGHAPVVELLLSKGAEPNSQGGFHGNALQAAAAAGHVSVINLLLENKPPALVDIPGGWYGSALRAAVHSGSTRSSDTVWALLEEKANPNKRLNGHGSLLEEAANMGTSHREIVRDLLTAGADADTSPKGNGVHIMHRASMHGMKELVEYCIKHHCQIDMVTTEGPRYRRKYNDFPDEMTPLGYACAEGHINIVDLLLEHGAPFEEDRKHSALLWTAAYQGHADVVDLLLRRFKESHNAEETAHFFLQRPHPKSGHPVMFAGASSGNPDVVETLIKHGAKYEANWYKATPLLATATFSCPEVAKRLLSLHQAGIVDCLLDMRANNGRTALFEACALKRPNIALMLLESGADYLIKDNDGGSTLQRACYNGLFRVVDSIVNKAEKELRQEDFLKLLNSQHRPSGRTALLDCAEQERIQILDLLLRKSADYRIPENQNATILHMSSRPESSTAMDMIVRKAAHDLDRQQFLDFVNTRHSPTGKTSLLDCVERGRVGATQILVDSGANIDIAGHAGNGPLHWAAMNGHDEVIKLILKKAKQDAHDAATLTRYVNRVNKRERKQGQTALMLAGRGNYLSTVKLLLGHGAWYMPPDGPDAPDGGRYPPVTALHDASHAGAREVVTHLLDVASKELDHERFAKWTNARNDHGKTALYDACETGRPLIVKMLVEKYRADCMITNNGNINTPLFAASWNGHTSTVAALLESASAIMDPGQFKAFLHHGNNMRKTALMDACQTNRPAVVRLLLEYGTDYSLLDQSNFTALHYCAFRKHIDCVRILLEHGKKDNDQARFKRFLSQQSNTNKASALRDAVLQGHSEVAKLILEYGPAYWDLDSGKRSPLHQALGTNNADLALKLVQYANQDKDRERVKRHLYAKDENGDWPWNGAKWRKFGKVMDAMRATGLVDG